VKKKILIIILAGILLSGALTSTYNALAGRIEPSSSKNDEVMAVELEPSNILIEESNVIDPVNKSNPEEKLLNQTDELDIEEPSTENIEPSFTETITPTEDLLLEETTSDNFQGKQGNGKGSENGNGNGIGNQNRYRGTNDNKGNFELDNEQ